MLTHILLTVVFALACAVVLRRRKYNPPKGKAQVLYVYQNLTFERKIGFKLPPGPPGNPIFGYFFRLSEVLRPSLMYEWKKKYGDIVSINTLGIPVIFVYSDEIARELFEKRGATYSDRPAFHMANLLGWDYNVALYPYGDWWRRHRRAMQQYFNSRAVSMFEPIGIKSCRLLLQDLLQTPSDFPEHIKFCIGRIIMDTVYGIEIKRKNDTFIDTVHIALEGVDEVLLPGQWLVDIFPMFKYIPHWIPGLTVNKFIKKYKKATRDTTDIPFNIVKNRENIDHSFVSNSLERLRDSGDPSPDREQIIKNAAGIAYSAGAGTTFAVALQAILASLSYPEVQKKAQAELDQVLGDRRPTLADRNDLPYVNAFCYEVIRWRPSAPLGVAHAALEDGVYGEYFIPKGSIVIADSCVGIYEKCRSELQIPTSWQILRSKKYGPNPEDFNPERFLQPGVHPPTEQFGFGRRICPGRFFADNMLFLLIALILKVFDIAPMKDENGVDITISDENIVSFLPFPLPFQCSFTPRSPHVNDLMLARDD